MGADWFEGVQQQARQFLDPGEHLIAAFQAQPRGTAMARGATAGLAPQAAAGGIGRRWAKGSKEEAGRAGLQLASPMVLGLSEQRLLVLTGKKKSLGTGKITQIDELLSSVPLSEVGSIQVKSLLVGKSVRIGLSSGEVKLEVPPGNDAKGFAAEFERVRAAI
ncbi:MAG: hypothetical protein ACYC0H_12240 [Solirubrobacteraceae bacterium]